jgi:tripartite-type tricarboxylate transporter receptor subunit TctC
LGISSLTRSPELPDVPTIAETGLPGHEYVAWFGVFAPGTTRPELVAHINALLREIVDKRAIGCAFKASSRKFSRRINFVKGVRLEIERWGPVIGKSGIKGSL